jgi:hypothetical protein
VSISRYFDIGVNGLEGLYSAEYSLNNNINTLFGRGNQNAISTYPDLPEIELSYQQYINKAGSFDINESNILSEYVLVNKQGGASCALAYLSQFEYIFSVDNPFLVKKTFKGFAKPSSQGSRPKFESKYSPNERQDYTGSLPPGISGDLISVNLQISINRQPIGQFGSKKPYALVAVYPTTSSITYTIYGSETLTQDVSQTRGCATLPCIKFSASVGSCSTSYPIEDAFLTSINYSGANAARSSDFQTISVTYTSYTTIPGLEPIILFPE